MASHSVSPTSFCITIMSLISKLSKLVSPSDRSEHISTRHSLHSQTGEVRAVGTSPYFVATDVTGKEDSQWFTREFPKTEGRIKRAARSIILPRETAPASQNLVAGVGQISTSGCTVETVTAARV